MNLVELSKELMYKQTQKNNSPVWLLTEIAIEKGKKFSKKYNVDERLVLTSLYLAHTSFNFKWKKEILSNHPTLSAEFVKKYLDKWKVNKKEQKIILDAIKYHHTQKNSSKIAEVMRNAECFKFVTVKGSLIWLHALGKRGYTYDKAVEKVLHKMEQKRKLLSLDSCVKEGEANCKQIRKMFA